ncbi:hypothetical protein niasHT_028302 [Heterodera trifolii]|uniref:Uncharacterized protein n=1 Tax=Heterodera trifolii TaxID=157864 RepID=A0ABD2JVZ0_9BILA
MPNLSWVILYEPRGDGLVAPHPLFNARPEVPARVIDSAPLISPLHSGIALTSTTVPSAVEMNVTMSTDGVDPTASAPVMSVQIWSALLLFTNYAIILPLFIICWLSIVRWLRHTGLMPPPSPHSSTPTSSRRQINNNNNNNSEHTKIRSMFSDGGESGRLQQQQTAAVIREANRVTSQIAAATAIPEPMRSVLTASVAIPMIVSAAQTGGGGGSDVKSGDGFRDEDIHSERSIDNDAIVNL